VARNPARVPAPGPRRYVLAFHEQVGEGWFVPGEVACAAVIVAGVIMLARSPLLAADGPSGRD